MTDRFFGSAGETAESKSWSQFRSYPDEQASIEIYENIRDWVFERDLDVSVFRLRLGLRFAVGTIGDNELSRGDKTDLDFAFGVGELAEVSPETLHHLTVRRSAVLLMGFDRFERRVIHQ